MPASKEDIEFIRDTLLKVQSFLEKDEIEELMEEHNNHFEVAMVGRRY